MLRYCDFSIARDGDILLMTDYNEITKEQPVAYDIKNDMLNLFNGNMQFAEVPLKEMDFESFKKARRIHLMNIDNSKNTALFQNIKRYTI